VAEAASHAWDRFVVLSVVVATGLAAAVSSADAFSGSAPLAPAVAEFDQPAEWIATSGDLADPPPSIEDRTD